MIVVWAQEHFESTVVVSRQFYLDVDLLAHAVVPSNDSLGIKPSSLVRTGLLHLVRITTDATLSIILFPLNWNITIRLQFSKN